MDVAEIKFSLRQGLGWSEVNYSKLIQALCDLGWETKDLTDLTKENLKTIIDIVYPMWGADRIDYSLTLMSFLQKWQPHIKEDCIRKNSFISEVIFCKRKN